MAWNFLRPASSFIGGVRANQTTQETSSVSCGGAVAGGGTAAVIAHALKAVDLRGTEYSDELKWPPGIARIVAIEIMRS